MPMGIGAPNRIRYPCVPPEEIPACPFFGRIPPYFYLWTEQKFAMEAHYTQVDIDNYKQVHGKDLYSEGGHYHVFIIGRPSEHLVKLMKH